MHSRQKKVVYFDNSLPADLRNQISKNDLQAFKTASAIAALGKFGIKAKTSQYKTYIFPDNFEAADLGDVNCYNKDDLKIVAFGFSGLADKIFACEQDGMILSACASSRQNSASAEAWVFTHPDHRRKGLGQQVVTAWAANLQGEGVIPFYSHNVENTNSAGLAKKLNLIHVFDEMVIVKAS